MQAFPTLEAQPFNSSGVAHNKLINLPSWLDPFTTEFDFYADGTTTFDITAYKATGDSYFVDYENGSDSNDGLTLATAKKSVDAAISLVRSGNREIVTLVGGQTYYANTIGTLDDLSITFTTTDGTNAILVNGNEDDSANFSLVSNDMYVWTGAPVFLNILDETQQNYYEKWLHLEEQASSADVSTNGGWHHDGTDLYVKMPDNRAPDSSLRCLLGTSNRVGKDNNNIYFENISLYGYPLLPSFQGISHVYFYRCEFAYCDKAAINGSTHNSAQAFFYHVECTAHSVLKSDLWSASNSNYLYLQDCIGVYTTPGGSSQNITTAHGDSCIVAVNCLLADSQNNNTDDTSASRGVLYLCCRSYKTIIDYTNNGNASSFTFGSTTSGRGIYINCDDQDSVGGPSLLTEGPVDLINNSLRNGANDFGQDLVNYDANYIATNTPPTANAGTGATVAAGVLVNVSGSASSDGDGTIVSYEWEEITSVGVSLSSTTGENISFTSPTSNSQQTVTLQLTVTDDGGLTDTATVTFTVEAEVSNQPPIANAGPDQSVAAGARVQLNASLSSDPEDGSISQFGWEQVDNGADAVVLEFANTATPEFTAPSSLTAQTLEFRVQAQDSEGATSTDTVTVNVAALEENEILSTMETLDFELATQGNIVAYKGRSNREVMQLKPSSSTGVVTDGGYLDLSNNGIRKIEIIASGKTISNEASDSIKIDGTKILARLGDLDIPTSGKDSIIPTFMVVLYVGSDTRGLVVASNATAGYKPLSYRVEDAV